MGLLTIGAFAKASRLSPKALRLYDELGLLNPARVDPVTGYRLYARDQLDQARLVAWLRRLGMPLARIQHVCTLDAAGAAQEIRSFWAQVEADTAARRDLATFLIDHLSWKDPAMSPTTKPLGIRYAALSDTEAPSVRATRTPRTPGPDCSPSPMATAAREPPRAPRLSTYSSASRPTASSQAISSTSSKTPSKKPRTPYTAFRRAAPRPTRPPGQRPGRH